ncbi:hypothetical protein EDD66_1195 [Mobilisporobacter senegalensis]|uniref:Uncharacterized protein n=1 Tax=Mobilisporobacter senegalensis TaxID=1329262 RepID=A0A3N1X541_9FIRM|nr:DUF6715 family protein [Mobilisporobacter senegalensis]ROR21896.1 hypothetical protein EDD66_1195 [Mobilisporobacter senegalensis]
MKGLGNRNSKNFVVFIVLMGIIFSLYFYLNNNKQEETAQVKTEAEKLLAKDLEAEYPASPTTVVKLYNRISKCLYNGKWDNDEVNQLIDMIRKLYSSELLVNNPEEKHNQSFKSDIAEYQDKKRKISDYRVDGNGQMVTWEKEGIEYASLNAIYYIAENKNHDEIYQNFVLKKEGKQWKILGWTNIPEIDIEE